MTRLPEPDRWHIEAALGWLMLENAREASLEFQKIERREYLHPDFLQVHCRVLIAEKQWKEALDVSRRQLAIDSNQPHSWINRAYCLHELRRTREAVDLLKAAARRFPKQSLITFNLACYCCHLKRYTEAHGWVTHTLQLVES